MLLLPKVKYTGPEETFTKDFHSLYANADVFLLHASEKMQGAKSTGKFPGNHKFSISKGARAKARKLYFPVLIVMLGGCSLTSRGCNQANPMTGQRDPCWLPMVTCEWTSYTSQILTIRPLRSFQVFPQIAAGARIKCSA